VPFKARADLTTAKANGRGQRLEPKWLRSVAAAVVATASFAGVLVVCVLLLVWLSMTLLLPWHAGVATGVVSHDGAAAVAAVDAAAVGVAVDGGDDAAAVVVCARCWN